MAAAEERVQPAAEMVAAAPLGALGLWIVNDHLLKGAGYLPAALTGKLSDGAGLFCFPVLLVAGARLATGKTDPAAARRLMVGAACLTATVFSALKLVSPLAVALLRVG